MYVKNPQSVVCNVATQCGNVTNMDSKGYDVAMAQPPAMSSPQYPAPSEPTLPGLRLERGTHCSTIQAAKRTGLLASWAGSSGTRWTFLARRSEASGKQNFPRHIRNLAIFAAFTADRDDQDTTIRFESLAGAPKA